MKWLIGLVASGLLFCQTGWGESWLETPAAEGRKSENRQAAPAEMTEFTCPRPNSDEEIAVRISLPAGWKRNPAFGTAVFEPGNAGDFFESPNIEVRAACEGECHPEKIAANIDSYVQRLKEGWKRLATGNEDLDKLGTRVEVLKDETAGDARVFEVSLTYPEGVSSAMYPPRVWLYRFIHKAGDPYFILVKGMVPAPLKGEFLSAVEASCNSADKR